MERLLFKLTIAVWITVPRGEDVKLSEEELHDYYKWTSSIIPPEDYKDNQRSFWLRLGFFSMVSKQQFDHKKRENNHNISNEVEPVTDTDSPAQKFFQKQVRFNYEFETLFPTPWNSSNYVVVPRKVDWRLRNAIRVPADYHTYCTASYAFAVAATIDAHINYWTEFDYAPSPRVFMKCPYGNDVKYETFDPCDDRDWYNGTPDAVIRSYKFAILNGLQDRDRYPYIEGKYQPCDDSGYNDEAFWTEHLTGYVIIPHDDDSEINLMVAVALYGPVTVSFESTHANLDLLNYGGGIYDGPCGKGKMLTMMVIGYGEEKGKQYWLLQNSRGPNWGQYGYIKIARYGQCDITQQMVFPIVNAYERIYGFHTAEDDWWTNLETKLVMNAVHRKYNYTSEMDLPPELKLSNDEPSVWN
ncbi:hypothetical protein GE061_006389 [Apolygus lucorum]|uniref:Peptidase C1A papain C-terminal domain-containing protein n=1 Tax=Apolygus lucorum TaxID=248454 RepID=A0A6A4IZ59_APOLU|nr:hypothetical protein GE061_006389 [Apolygus lucorum]